MGLSNAAMAGSLGRYEQTKCIIEVKNKEGDEWKILETW